MEGAASRRSRDSHSWERAMVAKKCTKHASERRYQFRLLMTRVKRDEFTRVFEHHREHSRRPCMISRAEGVCAEREPVPEVGEGGQGAACHFG